MPIRVLQCIQRVMQVWIFIFHVQNSEEKHNIAWFWKHNIDFHLVHQSKEMKKKSRHINRIVIIRTTSILTEIFVFSLQNSIESIFKFHFEKKVVVHIWNSFYLSETRVYSVYKWGNEKKMWLVHLCRFRSVNKKKVSIEINVRVYILVFTLFFLKSEEFVKSLKYVNGKWR